MSETTHDVLPGSSPEKVIDPEIAPAPDHTPEPAPGSKTPPENLKAALDEERRMRKEAEERATLAEEALIRGEVPAEEFSDEGREIIERHVKPLADEVTRLTEQLTMKDLLEKFPVLKDRKDDFSEYRKGKTGVSLEDAAKLFLADNNLLSAPSRRKGLEEPRGGERTPSATKMTAEDIDSLRKTDYAKYIRLLREGKLDLDGNE